MDYEIPPSVAINVPNLNLFPDQNACMGTLGDENICAALSTLQFNANAMKQAMNDIIIEKQIMINRLNRTLLDRPLTMQQQAALEKKVTELEAEVTRLSNVEQGMRNMPAVINQVNDFISGMRSGVKRPLEDEKRPLEDEDTVEEDASTVEEDASTIEDLSETAEDIVNETLGTSKRQRV